MPGAPVDVDEIELFNYVFGMGEAVLVGAGPFQLEATALRDVVLGCGPYLETIAGVLGEVTSIRIAGAEMLSGDQAVPIGCFAPDNTATDGTLMGKLLKAGETVIIEGDLDGAETIRGGFFLLE